MTILIWDAGLFVEQAIRLAQDGYKILYYTPWVTAFPKFETFAYGLGMEGIQKILYFWEHVDEADMIVVFDVGAGDIVSHLRKMGKVVFGSNRAGDEMEQNRWAFKQLLKKLGLPVSNAVRVKGIEELRDYLKKNKNKYVKVDIFRGDINSFPAKDYDSVKLHLEEIEVALGPFADVYQFIVEDVIEGCEPGFDLFFNGKEFLKPYLYGIEFEKSAYLGRYVNELPKPLKLIADKLTPYLREIDYRGAISAEIRITKEGTPYIIDICSRLPAPLSAVYVESIKNFSEVVVKIAKGESVKLNVAGEYVCILPVQSTRAEKSWLKLNVDPKFRNIVKFRMPTKLNNEYYSVRGMETVFILVAVGNSIKEVKDKIESNIKNVDALGLVTDISLDPLFKQVEEAKKYGIIL